jgi:hypothetical protein
MRRRKEELVSVRESVYVCLCVSEAYEEVEEENPFCDYVKRWRYRAVARRWFC